MSAPMLPPTPKPTRESALLYVQRCEAYLRIYQRPTTKSKGWEMAEAAWQVGQACYRQSLTLAREAGAL